MELTLTSREREPIMMPRAFITLRIFDFSKSVAENHEMNGLNSMTSECRENMKIHHCTV